MNRHRLYPLVALLFAASLAAQARLGDLVSIDGVRDNEIKGLGLVIGLNGTGDTGEAARTLASNMLRRLQLNLPPSAVAPDNVAVVLVTCTLPPFKKNGDRLDVTVSSIGDAKNLFGGQLVETQLLGPDNRTMYAVATGPVLTGAATAQGASGSKETINHPTVGRVPNGAILEKEVPQKILNEGGQIRFRLREASYATAVNLRDQVNRVFPGAARALDGVTVVVTPPKAFAKDPVTFLAQVNDLRVVVDAVAKVVISERNGTIVVGDNVTLLPCAVSHGSLTISVTETPDVSQPGPFSNGTTQVVPRSDVKITEKGTEMRKVPGATSAGELARALNGLGVSPRDLVTIFQMLKANGALQAELVIQ